MGDYFWDGKASANPAINLLQWLEWGAPGDARAKHAFNAAMCYKGNRLPISTTAGYLYSGETVSPPVFKPDGARVVFTKAGCRPRVLGAQLYHQTVAGTYYINRFTDGEVWVNTTANSRNGTKISNSAASLTNPRDLRYLMIRLVGGGGSGGAANAIYSGRGGSGAATRVCCIKLPENGYATVYVAPQTTASSVTCGTFTCTANGGQNGGNNQDTGDIAGGTAPAVASTADGIVIASAAGGVGGGRARGGGGSSISFTDYAPEGGNVAWSQSGISSGAGYGGSGGSSTLGAGGKSGGGLGANGSTGTGPGAGGSGGRYGGSGGAGAVGLPGALTIWY